MNPNSGVDMLFPELADDETRRPSRATGNLFGTIGSGPHPHDSPHFQTTPKALLKTVCSARVVANCSMRGWSLVSGMLGISS